VSHFRYVMITNMMTVQNVGETRTPARLPT